MLSYDKLQHGEACRRLEPVQNLVLYVVVIPGVSHPQTKAKHSGSDSDTNRLPLILKSLVNLQ